MLLQIIRGLRWIENDRRIEKSEEDDETDIEDEEQWPSVTELGSDGNEPVRTLTSVEIGDRRRQQQQRGGEYRRNDA